MVGGLCLLPGPPPHPNFQVLTEARVRQSNTSGAGAPSRAESGVASQELAGSQSGGMQPEKVNYC